MGHAKIDREAQAIAIIRDILPWSGFVRRWSYAKDIYSALKEAGFIKKRVGSGRRASRQMPSQMTLPFEIGGTTNVTSSVGVNKTQDMVGHP